ncbi:hypothetical protein HK102_006328 [Quaeritorhiza haematococci]|nr:hypothetical protein HK102_006328 [Quaeritorhiza haematococci]
MPARAAALLNQRGLASNIDLTERIAAVLYKSGLFEKAGELYEKLGSNDRALEAYKRGKAFRPAVELTRQVYPQQVVALEEQWGDHLMSIKQMDAAINHYIEANKPFKAIEAAIAAKQWKKAVSIVDTLDPPSSAKSYFLQLAKHFDEVQDYAIAEKYYVLGGRPQDAVDMYTKANKWEKAHTLATTYMSPDEVAFLYVSQAREMEARGKLKEAEKLYLTVGEPDLAINMYKNHKQYDHMIRLVTAYHKDLLDETHLYLAKTLETEGNLRQAEHHYIEGKDWKSAINMYCANNMYEEAYRVGKAYGGPNSAKQVAYLWARSLGGESAVKLLTKFGLLDAAIDFATENLAFDFAFELSRFTADKLKLAEVHYKHAMFLEDEGKFKEAENAFILAGKPKEAILMYIHNENWEEALSVAETYDPGSVPEVLVGQAKIAFERKDYTKAESLLLRAQRPDLAIKFYKDSGVWKEALRFAKEYLPNKLAEVHEEYERYISGKNNSGKEEIISTARMLEQQKEYSRAVEMYLRLNVQHTTDMDVLEQSWMKAVEIAGKFLGGDRTQEVVSAVGARLVENRRYGSAGELYATAERYKDAIDAYITGGLWEKARGIVASSAPKYADYVENAYVVHLKSQGHAEKLVDVDVVAGLDMFAQRGEWDKCLETAARQDQEVLIKYLLMYCLTLLKDSKYEHAVHQIVKYNVPSNPSCFDLYLRLAREILNSRSAAGEGLTALREMLFKLVHGSTLTPQTSIPTPFHDLLTITHLVTLRNYCAKKRDLLTFAAKQSISLLRYTKEITPDKAFYEAGAAAKAAGMSNMAFVCWNRFLDISEAIEEGDASVLENADFENTDVPFDVELPGENMAESKREEVRDWILQVSLDQKINQEIDRRECEECGTSIYDASLVCYRCKHRCEPCVITGYPVLKNKAKCTSCQRPANKDDWNKFLMIERHTVCIEGDLWNALKDDVGTIVGQHRLDGHGHSDNGNE